MSFWNQCHYKTLSLSRYRTSFFGSVSSHSRWQGVNKYSNYPAVIESILILQMKPEYVSTPKKEFIWAGPWENVSYVICKQQRRRSNCASAQSDQHLCCLLLRQYNISRFYSRNFKTLASFCGCAGRLVTGLVGNSRRHILSWWGSFESVHYQMKQVTFCINV